MKEGEVDVPAAFVAGRETPEAVQPGMCALHDPAVAAELLGTVHVAAGAMGRDGAGAALGAAPAGIVGSVGVELAGVSPFSRPAMASREGASIRLSRWLAPLSVRPSGVPPRSTTRRCFVCPICRELSGPARSHRPFLTGIEALSNEARLQSRRSESANRSSKAR